MTRKDGLPRRVYLKCGRYYYVTPAGKWVGLTREEKGLPEMFRALAKLTESESTSDLMPAVIARWLDDAADAWGTKQAAQMERIAKVMSARMVEFGPRDVTTVVVVGYLKPYRKQPRTHNLHRSVLRQVMSQAAREGLRDGHNPVDDVPQMKLASRRRIVTDDEVKALKKAALQQARNGQALVQMIDLALLTGQRISDVIGLRWQDVGKDGIRFRQGKTDAALLVEWSPALKAAIAVCAQGREKIGHVLVTQSGKGYRYAGIRSAWVRACQRAGIEDLHIHDLRGRAGVDAIQGDKAQDIRAAQRLLGHTSEAMTREYVDGKYHKRVKPAR